MIVDNIRLISNSKYCDMKRIAFIICICLFALSSQAQEPENHLKFMGIELNGTITDFQKKLSAKGVTVSPQSKYQPNGMRLFNGSFSGEKADIVVFYNPHTKGVYRAKAMIKRYGKDSVTQLMNSMKNKLDAKYGTDNKNSDIVKDDYLHEFMQYSYDLQEGIIGLFISSTGFSDQNDFYLQIDYADRINNIKNIQEELDDL